MIDTIITQFLNDECPEIPFQLYEAFHNRLEQLEYIIFVPVPKMKTDIHFNTRQIGTTIKRLPSKEIVNKSYIVNHSAQYKVKSTFRIDSVALEQEEILQ